MKEASMAVSSIALWELASAVERGRLDPPRPVRESGLTRSNETRR